MRYFIHCLERSRFVPQIIDDDPLSCPAEPFGDLPAEPARGSRYHNDPFALCGLHQTTLSSCNFRRTVRTESMSSSVSVAITVILILDASSATDGGLIAWANIPSAKSAPAAPMAFSAPPIISGMMGVSEFPGTIPRAESPAANLFRFFQSVS